MATTKYNGYNWMDKVSPLQVSTIHKKTVPNSRCVIQYINKNEHRFIENT